MVAVLINQARLPAEVALPPLCRQGSPELAGAGPSAGARCGARLRKFVEDGGATQPQPVRISGSTGHSPAGDFSPMDSGFGGAMADRPITHGWPRPPGPPDHHRYPSTAPPDDPHLGPPGAHARPGESTPWPTCTRCVQFWCRPDCGLATVGPDRSGGAASPLPTPFLQAPPGGLRGIFHPSRSGGFTNQSPRSPITAFDLR